MCKLCSKESGKYTPYKEVHKLSGVVKREFFETVKEYTESYPCKIASKTFKSVEQEYNYTEISIDKFIMTRLKNKAIKALKEAGLKYKPKTKTRFSNREYQNGIIKNTYPSGTITYSVRGIGTFKTLEEAQKFKQRIKQ